MLRMPPMRPAGVVVADVAVVVAKNANNATNVC